MNKHDLKGRLDAVNNQIAEKTAVAQSKWAAFEQSRETIAQKGFTTPGPAVKAAEAIHDEYVGVAAELKSLEDQRNGIFAQMAAGGRSGKDPRSNAEGFGSMGEKAAGSFELKQVIDSGALDSDRQHFQAKLASMTAAETKGLITGLSDSSAGAFVSTDRAGYVPLPQRTVTLLDLITVGQTSSDAIEFARQTTFTNAAAEIAEATTILTGTKPESALAFEKVTATVKQFAHWVRTTRRALADAGQLQMIIDQQLRSGLQLRLESQLISGDGTGETLTGILNTSGILTQAKGSDTVVDAIHKGITQLRLGYVEPSAVLINPTDWEVVRLSKDTDGAYYYGPPSQAGAQTIFGIPAIVTTAVPDDTAIVGDFSQLALWVREGLQVLASDSDGDQFTHNIITILAEMRAASGVLMPSAFCRITSVD